MRTATHDLKSLLNDWLAIKTLPNIAISALQLDSNKVQAGDLFFAFPGVHIDSRQFIAQAAARGAAAILMEAQGAEAFDVSDIECPVIPLDDLRNKISALASHFYRHPSKGLSIIGITGTNGKTSCCHFIAQALAQIERNVAVMGTLGHGELGQLVEANKTTADPITVQKHLAQLRDADEEIVAMEVSSHALDQGRVHGVTFSTAVFTNLTRDHLDYHQTMNQYGEAKARLFSMPGLEQAVINADDAFGLQLIETLKGKLSIIAYTCDAQRVVPHENVQWVVGQDIHYYSDGISFTLDSPWGKAQIQTRLLGEINVYNLLVAFSVLRQLNIPFKKIVDALPHVAPVKGRMECLSHPNMPSIVIDYAHSPDALAHALRALRQHLQGQLICIVGCGGDRDQGKRAQIGRVAEQYSNYVVLTNDNPRTESPQAIVDDMLSGFAHPESATVILDRTQAIAHAVAQASSEDVVLVAGKGHETYQVIGHDTIPYSDHAVVENLFISQGR